MFWKSKSKAKGQREPDVTDNKNDETYDERRVLYANNFEHDFQDWQLRRPYSNHGDFGKYVVTADFSRDEFHSGGSSLLVSGRMRGWNGVFLDVTKYIKESVTDYECRAWVKLKPDAKSCIVHLSVEIIDCLGGVLIPKFYYMDDFSPADGILSKYRLPVGTFDENDIKKPANDYPHNPKNITTENNWVLLRSKLQVRKSNIHSVLIYIETDDEGGENDIYIDDFVLLSGFE